MIEVIDDVLPKEQYDVILSLLTAYNFLWRYSESTVSEEFTVPGRPNDTPQFVRPIFLSDADSRTEENQIITKYPEFYNISVEALMKSERTDIKDIIKFERIKANLLTPWPNAPRFHPPHTDTEEENSLSCIYYLHDSDGDTYFFGDDNRTVTPKANRAVLFDAYHKHCSSNPINNDRRIIVNSVFQVEKE